MRRAKRNGKKKEILELREISKKFNCTNSFAIPHVLFFKRMLGDKRPFVMQRSDFL